VNLNFDITEPFTLDKSSTSLLNTYERCVDYYTISKYFDKYKNNYNFQDYDSNHDGSFDGLIFIYSVPYDHDTEAYWAYKYNYVPDSVRKYGFKKITKDNVSINAYIWAGVEFLYNEYGRGPYRAPLSTQVYTHETGHLFGLDDFYDYYKDLGTSGGLWGADMMDYNVGDHGPYNKIALGWQTPMIVDSSLTVTLAPSSTGQSLLIPYQPFNSYFQEYLLIDYYTPSELYWTPQSDDQFYAYSFSTPGIRIYHVDARPGQNLGTEFSSAFINDNSDSPHKFICYLSATSHFPGITGVSNSDLFTLDHLYNLSRNSWNDDTPIQIQIQVLQVTTTGVTIQIQFPEGGTI
jgi:M6 family metalloprotease-like protein